MIVTQAYNDFSSFSYEERRDYNFMLNQLKEFAKNGGDATLMVRLDNYGDKIELITFRDYVKNNIKNGEDFFKDLMKEGVLPGLCDLNWDSKIGAITETKDYGIKWMKSNYKEYSDVIKQSIEKLLKDLPDNIEQIKTLKTYDYYGKIEEKSHRNPLFEIAEEINQEEIYNMVFSKKPEIKKEWLKTGRRDEQPLFLSTIEAIWNDVRNPELGVLFYKHDICKDYMHKEENKEKLHDLIRYAVYDEDYDFLNEALPKIDLSKLEENKHSHDLCLPRAKSKKMVNLLLDHNATVEHVIKSDKTTYDVNVLFSDELRSFEAFSAIIERNEKYRKMIVEQPENFYTLMGKKDFEFTKVLIEKYNFPLEKFDMLSIAWQKDGDFEWLVKNGADIRECASFCSEIVSAREDGLKKLRLLNKEGFIVAKAPDFIFNIFNSSPTKNFINYYDKLTAQDVEKTTKNGYPAWWGAKTPSDYKFMQSRISNPMQKANDGKTYLFYVLERETENYGRNRAGAKEAFKNMVEKMNKKFPDEKLDLSYVDEKGNTFLHLLVKVEKYGKDSIDADLLELIKENSSENPFSYMMKKNKKGIMPIEILLTQETKYNWSSIKVIKDAITNESINFSEKLSSGEKIGDKLVEYFKDDKEFSIKLHSEILNSELSQKEVKTKKMKI
jgi:Arc/MetJ-type ribon-helix-helix transcriptional regulator